MEPISIVVLNYNGKEVLAACLDSIFKGLEPPYEVIVLDNASTDDSLKVCERFPVRIEYGDNRFQFVGGLNDAFRYAKYQSVLFVSNDVCFQWDGIRQLRLLLESVPKSIIQPLFLWPDGSVQHAGMKLYWPMYGLAETKVPEEPFYTTSVFATACFMMRKDTFKEVGEFDVALAPGHYEDVDYSLRADKLSIPLLVYPYAKVYHIGAHSFNKVYGKRGISAIAARNREYLVRKHFKGWDKWSRLLAIRAIRLASSGRSGRHNSLAQGLSG